MHTIRLQRGYYYFLQVCYSFGIVLAITQFPYDRKGVPHYG